MTSEEIVEALKGPLPDVPVEIASAIDQPTIVVPRERIVELCTALRDTPSLRFDLLDLTAVDWWPGEPRFQMVYHMGSIGATPRRLRVKAPVPGEDAHIATLSTMWPSANWLEREVFDLFGIIFDGHPDLRRVLMPEDWEGYPLRKDYPVQVKLPVKIYEPLEVTPEEFAARIERDRHGRGPAGTGSDT